MNTLKIIFICLLTFTSLYANETKIKIAISKDMVPYSFIDDNNEANGIFVDYWKLWAKKSGVELEFKAYGWKETLEAVKKGEVDIHSGLFQNEQRKEFIKYLDKIYPSQSYLYANKNKTNLKTIEDISGKTIGVQAGAYFETYFQKNYPDIKVKNYKNFSQRFNAVKKGEIDIFVDDSLIAWFQLIKDVSFNNFNTIEGLEFTKWFYSGIRKNDKALEELVLNGLKKITTEDIIDIERKWIVSDKYRYFEKKKNLDDLSNKEGIEFSKKERDFISKKRVIKFSEINWAPLSIIEKDEFTGLFSDYLKIIEEKTNIKFEFVKAKNWQDVIDKFEKKEIDIIPGLGDISFTFDDALVTSSFTSFKFAIVSKHEQSFLEGLQDISNKTLAQPRNYSSTSLIRKMYPNINIIETNTVPEALKLVSKNKADLFVGHSAIAVYNIKNSFPDLKIAGLSDERFNHYILIQDKYPELESIINKVLHYIPFEKKQDIKNKWIKTEVTTEVDYSVIYKIIAGFTLALIVVLIFTRKLSSAKKEIEHANSKLQDTVNALVFTKDELLKRSKDLKEQKDTFETLFNDTTDGLSLIKDGKFIDCNNAILKMLNYPSKKAFLESTPFDISAPIQEDGELSELKAHKYMDICMSEGSCKFEWLHKKYTGELVYFEVVLTRITLNGEDVIHVVDRDIEDKKLLEKQNERRTFELEDANHELEISIENLKQTQQQLIESEKMASLGGLVAGVAHEINTPIGIGLTGVTHFEEITKSLKRSYDNDIMTQEDFEEYLKTSVELSRLININLNKAANLVKSFKQVAVDQTSEERREFYLHNYLDEILASIHSVTKKTKLDIKITCDKKIKINSFPGAISQIVTNLIMNSITHAYEQNQKGLIEVDVQKDDKKITLVYRDDGRGIKEENLHKIFDPFFTTNRENGGSGLGLNIIYNIVTNKLNGKITCSNKDKGVEFIITFNV